MFRCKNVPINLLLLHPLVLLLHFRKGQKQKIDEPYRRNLQD